MKATAHLLLMMLLVACGPRAMVEADVPQLPNTQSLVSGDFNLRVSRDGEMRWNGAPITSEELKSYANQIKAMRPLRLVVQFEGNEGNSAHKAVVKTLSDSESCQGQCFEAAWNAPRPPVVY